jgi:hypothetical protein
VLLFLLLQLFLGLLQHFSGVETGSKFSSDAKPRL